MEEIKMEIKDLLPIGSVVLLKEGKKKLLTALKYFNENKYDKAINILTELSKSSRGLKERSVCGLFIGTCYSDSGREQKAIEHYEGLIEMRLENDTICNNLGLLYEENGRPDKAVELFEKRNGNVYRSCKPVEMAGKDLS